MPKITPELVVSNLAQSMQFYEALGFVKDNEGIVDENGSQWNSLALGDAHLWLLRQDVTTQDGPSEQRRPLSFR